MAPTVPPQLEMEPPASGESSSNIFSPAAWRHDVAMPSLPEVHRTIHIAPGASWLRKMLAFAGPGYLVVLRYLDAGNSATDIRGGSKFCYALLSGVLISNPIAMVVQAL